MQFLQKCILYHLKIWVHFFMLDIFGFKPLMIEKEIGLTWCDGFAFDILVGLNQLLRWALISGHRSFPVASKGRDSIINLVPVLWQLLISPSQSFIPEICCRFNTPITTSSFYLSFLVLPVKFECIHPLQSYGWGSPPARGWRSAVLSGSTCFPRGKVYMRDIDMGHTVWKPQHIGSILAYFSHIMSEYCTCLQGPLCRRTPILPL